jgi:hypothetical protein
MGMLVKSGHTIAVSDRHVSHMNVVQCCEGNFYGLALLGQGLERVNLQSGPLSERRRRELALVRAHVNKGRWREPEPRQRTGQGECGQRERPLLKQRSSTTGSKGHVDESMQAISYGEGP